jgi:hypothetical protein
VAWAEWVAWISRPLRGLVGDMKARVKMTRAFCPGRTYRGILRQIAEGGVVHADETQLSR